MNKPKQQWTDAEKKAHDQRSSLIAIGVVLTIAFVVVNWGWQIVDLLGKLVTLDI